MRGADVMQESLFTTVRLESFVPAGHPIRPIRTLYDAALKRISPLLDTAYAEGGRESIPPERLLQVPTFAKNAMKSYRYATQGVNSLQGTPIVDDVSGPDDFRQLIGFQPPSVAVQQHENSVVYSAKDFVTQRR